MKITMKEDVIINNANETAELSLDSIKKTDNNIRDAILIFANSLLYLNNLTVEFKIQILQPEKVVWVFDVIDSDKNVKFRYMIDNIVECVKQANNNIKGLLNNNPGYEDKKYLISVGVEQALQQYHQTPA